MEHKDQKYQALYSLKDWFFRNFKISVDNKLTKGNFKLNFNFYLEIQSKLYRNTNVENIQKSVLHKTEFSNFFENFRK